MVNNNGYETLKDLKEICEHFDESGSNYCYEHKEACIYDENQTLCPDYYPKWKTNNEKWHQKKIIQ